MNMKRIVLAGILSLFALFSYAQEYKYHFLLAGASFAVPENGWFELVCDAFNAEAMNKAVSGDAIKHTASDTPTKNSNAPTHSSSCMYTTKT